MTIESGYDNFLSRGAWANAFYYLLPSIILMLVFGLNESLKTYLIPALLVYLIGVIAHLAAYGFQAICVQIKISSDHHFDRLIKTIDGQNEKNG